MFKRLFYIAVIAFLLAGCGGGGITVPAPVNWNAFTTFPSNAALDVLPDSSIVIDFGQEMDSSTITADTFIVTGPAGQVQGDISYVGNSATFTPLRILALATSYTVTLKAGIKNLAGNILNEDYSWNFRTQSGQWYTPVIIESVNHDASSPNIAADKNGNATAAWIQYDGNTQRIYANRYDMELGWGNETAIDPAFAKDGAYEPEIAMDDGNAIVVWIMRNNNQYILYSNFYTRVALNWTGSGPVTAGPLTNSFSPKVAMDPDGNSMAVWSEFTGATFELYADEYIFDTKWKTPVIIESSDDRATEPQIAFDSFGNAIVVWISEDNVTFKSNMSAGYYSAGSGWGAEVSISDRTGNVGFPTLAVNAGGEAVAMWWQIDDGVKNIYANHYSPVTGWGAAALVSGNIEIEIQPNVGPVVKMDSAGNAIGIWQVNDGVNRYIHSSRYTAGSGWEAAELVGSCGDLAPACNLDLDMDPNGNAVAIWQKSDQEGFRQSIYARHYILGSGWDTQAAYIGGGSRNATNPKVAVDEGGRASAVWLQYDGNYWNVVSARFQ